MSHDAEGDIEIVREELANTAPTQDQLLPLLLRVQRRLRHVPPDCIAIVAQHFNLSRADVHGVATFYQDLRDAPPPRHVVQICQAEACQAAGCRALAAHAQASLGVTLASAAADARVALEPAYCFGNCALGPTVRIGDAVHGRVDAARFDALMRELDARR